MVGEFPFAERFMEVLGDLVHRSIKGSDVRFAAHRWFIGSRLALGMLGPAMLIGGLFRVMLRRDKPEKDKVD